VHWTTCQLAQQIASPLRGDPDLSIHSAARLAKATEHEITYITSSASDADISSCRAGAVVVEESLFDVASDQLPATAYLIVEDAQAAFLEILALFHPVSSRPAVGVSPGAHVGVDLVCGDQTNVFPGASIGDHVVIGSRCDILSGAVIGDGSRLGDDVVVYPGAVLYPGVQVGNRVLVHANAVIGGDGFGYRFEKNETQPAGAYVKIPHYGTVILEDDVEIGAGTSVDRGMIDATVIGSGTKLDNQVQVGHNCRIGSHNAFASQVGVAGSVTTGSYVRCGGKVGISDHLELGSGSSIAAMAAVVRDVPAGQTQLGYPAGPESEQLRILIAQKRVPELLKTVKTLQQRIEQLERSLEELTAAVPSRTAETKSAA
jgi:UDP-3-O-[3-hydroxymyristoyl] glucosamine N-acyltransferase